MYKLIVPLSILSDGAKCFMITGKKQYTVRHSISIYDAFGICKEVEAKDDSVFLVDENGNINAHSGNKEVRIEVDDLYYLKKLYGVD